MLMNYFFFFKICFVILFHMKASLSICFAYSFYCVKFTWNKRCTITISLRMINIICYNTYVVIFFNILDVVCIYMNILFRQIHSVYTENKEVITDYRNICRLVMGRHSSLGKRTQADTAIMRKRRNRKRKYEGFKRKKEGREVWNGEL